MRQANPNDESLVHRDDLIDDRALAKEDEDEFGLRDVVAEIAALCLSVKTPAAVALYGSWGSGKSSLANLLAQRFDRGARVAFARFDAFKYAELPLRRHFLSQVAAEFGINGKFKDELYEAQKSARFRREGWKTLLAVVAAAGGLILVLAALAAAIAAAIAAASRGHFLSHFADALQTSLPGVVLATPIVAVVIGLVAKYVTPETTTNAPSSDEQFEQLFRELVERIKNKTKCERIVIFIDELDRCSAKEVVSTLETLRTFLDVPPCILIVAADQQALERALTEAARQETPFNTANPYYSAGSAYLDKIFQYQLPLPPMLSQTLSRFALKLIERRGGVWARVKNRAELVSVLVPTHVHSPRRVKALLNSFALLFRLALKRAGEKAIDENIEERVAELAKLVCLKTEFPLFAEDLQLDHRLPDLVLRLSKSALTDEERRQEFPGLTDEALARAGAFAKGKRAVAEVIAQQPEATATSTAGASGDDRAKEVEESHAKQLLHYLEKTRKIKSPGKDLIYLESSGAAFGLLAEVAEQVELAAIDGRADEVAELFGDLDPDDQEKAYRLLAHLVIEQPGIEAQNVVGALFRSLSYRKGDLDPVLDDLLNALVTYSGGYELEADDLQGALKLALASEADVAQEMKDTVLAREEATTDDELGLFILTHAPELSGQAESVGEVFAALLKRQQGTEVADAVSALGETEVGGLVDALDAEDDETAQGLGQFVEAAHKQQREAIAIKGLTRLAGSESAVAGDTARELVGGFSPISDPSLAAAILLRAKARPVPEWPTWLSAIDTDTGKSCEPLADDFDEYVRLLWQARFAPAPPYGSADEQQFSATAKELGRLRPDEEREPFDLLAGTTVNADAEFPTREQAHAALWELTDANVLGAEDVAALILEDLGRTLGSPASAYGAAGRDAFVLKQMVRPLQEVSDSDVARAFAQSAEDSSWSQDFFLEVARTRAACVLKRLEPATARAVKQQTLTALVDNASPDTDAALAEWLDCFRPEPVQMYRALRSRFVSGAKLAEPLRGSVRQLASSWSPEEKTALLQRVSPDYLAESVVDTVLADLELAGADPDGATTALVDAYASAGNNDEREQVMKLWQVVQPVDDRALTKLISRIYIPLVREGKGAAKIALRFFGLVSSPPTENAKERIKRELNKAAQGDEGLKMQVTNRLEGAGWIEKRSLFKRLKGS
jgi:hypothetical protein